MAWNVDFWLRFGGQQAGAGGDINSFLGSLSSKGISRKSRYRVEVLAPPGLNKPRDLSDRCETISFPGQNIKSTPDTLRFGPEREFATGMTYGPISATFISSQAQLEKNFFGIWQAGIVNKNTWEPRYYDNYTGGLRIWHLDEKNNDEDGVELFEVFPKLIGAQDVGHAQSNAYQTLTVEFTFHHWFAIDPLRTAPLSTLTPNPDREKLAPLQETRHGFHARNYKKSSLLKPGDAVFNPAATDPNAL